MLFSKRPSELTPEDIHRVVAEAVPEGSEVEFKVGLPAKKGRVEPWAAGEGRVGDHARNELLAEVVAFANAYGGWLLVGIEETDEKPARAAAVEPIRACKDLAERLRMMCRDCIDPLLPVLAVEGVAMQPDGAGVVVFHVPRSRKAPHRLTPTKECYRRHADRTEKMDMREIQDLTLQVERGMAALDRRFRELQERFAADFKQFASERDNSQAFGLRTTLLPLTPIYVERVYGNEAVRPPLHVFRGKLANNNHDLFILGGEGAWRPIIRGTVSVFEHNDQLVSREVHCDGLIEYRMMRAMEIGQLRLAVQWAMGMFCNGICSAERFRRAAGSPDVEYGIEFELAAQGGELPVASYLGDKVGIRPGPFPMGHPPFPRYSIGPLTEYAKLTQIFERDFWNATGHEPSSVAEVDFERAFSELGLL